MTARIRTMLKSRFNPEGATPITSCQALDIISEVYARPREVILSRDIGHEAVRIRLLAAMLALTYTDETLDQISQTFRRKDDKSLYRWMHTIVRLLKGTEFLAEWRYVRKQIGRNDIEPYEPRQLIRFPKNLPDDHPLTPERRACHRATVAYAWAVHMTHGENKRWK